jgi:DNA invertase Pin-like site-specific DNA recombinase
MKAILLVRISSVSQQLDEQTTSLINYAKTKGYSEDNLIIIEDVESAINLAEEERNGLNKMKTEISADNNINAVFVWELSRLTRKPTAAYSLRDYFNNNNIQLFCFSPQFQLLKSDLTDLDDNGSLLFALYIQMAEAEMRNKKARFHRSKIRNAKTGKYSGGFIKYGYYVDDKGYYQIKEDEADLIRYVFNRYEEGISLWKLNKELMERGLTDSLSFVNETLKTEAYTGLSNKYGMNRIYPQIISNEQFERCIEIKKKNNKRLDKTNEIYFAKGLIKCTHCGAKYMAMKSSIQYLCYNRFGREQKLDKTKSCRTSPIININILDTILFEACIANEAHYLFEKSEDRIEKITKQININKEKINAFRNNISKSVKKKERNNIMFLNGAIIQEKYLNNIKSIESEIKDINNIIVETNNINLQLLNRIDSIRASKQSTNNEYRKFEDNVYAIEDLKEKQQIVQRHIKEIKIIDEIPNHTRIVMIYFHTTPNVPLLYRVHYKKKPQLIEICEDYYDDEYLGYDEDFISIWGHTIMWQDVDFKIEKRFVRKIQ